MTKLTNKDAIEILTYANEWRRCCDEPSTRTMKMPDPKQFGFALDHAIEVLKRFDGAVEVVQISSIDPNDGCLYAFLNEDKEVTRLEKHKLYAVPKENK